MKNIYILFLLMLGCFNKSLKDLENIRKGSGQSTESKQENDNYSNNSNRNNEEKSSASSGRTYNTSLNVEQLSNQVHRETFGEYSWTENRYRSGDELRMERELNEVANFTPSNNFSSSNTFRNSSPPRRRSPSPDRWSSNNSLSYNDYHSTTPMTLYDNSSRREMSSSSEIEDCKLSDTSSDEKGYDSQEEAVYAQAESDDYIIEGTNITNYKKDEDKREKAPSYLGNSFASSFNFGSSSTAQLGGFLGEFRNGRYYTYGELRKERKTQDVLGFDIPNNFEEFAINNNNFDNSSVSNTNNFSIPLNTEIGDTPSISNYFNDINNNNHSNLFFPNLALSLTLLNPEAVLVDSTSSVKLRDISEALPLPILSNASALATVVKEFTLFTCSNILRPAAMSLIGFVSSNPDLMVVAFEAVDYYINNKNKIEKAVGDSLGQEKVKEFKKEMEKLEELKKEDKKKKEEMTETKKKENLVVTPSYAKVPLEASKKADISLSVSKVEINAKPISSSISQPKTTKKDIESTSLTENSSSVSDYSIYSTRSYSTSTPLKGEKIEGKCIEITKNEDRSKYMYQLMKNRRNESRTKFNKLEGLLSEYPKLNLLDIPSEILELLLSLKYIIAEYEINRIIHYIPFEKNILDLENETKRKLVEMALELEKLDISDHIRGIILAISISIIAPFETSLCVVMFVNTKTWIEDVKYILDNCSKYKDVLEKYLGTKVQEKFAKFLDSDTIYNEFKKHDLELKLSKECLIGLFKSTIITDSTYAGKDEYLLEDEEQEMKNFVDQLLIKIYELIEILSSLPKDKKLNAEGKIKENELEKTKENESESKSEEKSKEELENDSDSDDEEKEEQKEDESKRPKTIEELNKLNPILAQLARNVLDKVKEIFHHVKDKITFTLANNHLGYIIKLPLTKSRELVIRIMLQGGGRLTPYYRIMVTRGPTYIKEGLPSKELSETHIDISPKSLKEIIEIVLKIWNEYKKIEK